MKRKVITAVAAVALLAVFLVSLVNVLRARRRYSEADDLYTDLQERYVETVATQSTAVTESSAASEPQEPTPTAPIRVDFAALQEECADVVGWLYCPGTPINYPVVQGKTNEQYLRSDLSGNYLFSGTLFVDFRCAAPAAGENYILYGHNMDDGSMFGSLPEYGEQRYYDAHPLLYYLTPDDCFVIELSAGAVIDSDDPIYTPHPADTSIDAIRHSSRFLSEVELTSADAVFTLSTCSYEYDGARFVLLGKATRLGAS